MCEASYGFHQSLRQLQHPRKDSEPPLLETSSESSCFSPTPFVLLALPAEQQHQRVAASGLIVGEQCS